MIKTTFRMKVRLYSEWCEQELILGKQKNLQRNEFCQNSAIEHDPK